MAAKQKAQPLMFKGLAKGNMTASNLQSKFGNSRTVIKSPRGNIEVIVRIPSGSSGTSGEAMPVMKKRTWMDQVSDW